MTNMIDGSFINSLEKKQHTKLKGSAVKPAVLDLQSGGMNGHERPQHDRMEACP